ncbi:MAG: protein translocase subunit SecF [Candidatus Zambryskibacteria bacterium]|nr:protein translocase subunit SecF [Candidatus Zambryskibacteria bacterium]
MFFIRHRKIWFAFSTLLILVSFYAMFVYGFNLSIDFRGGTITEVRYDGERPNKDSLESAIGTLGLGGFSVRPSGEDSYVIRTKDLTEADRANLGTALSLSSSTYTIERQNTIGPTAGAELRSKAVKAIAVVVLMIVLFITFAFRKVSKPVGAWKYALVTIVALAHDVIIPTGIFVWLGYLAGFEIDLLFVSGLLAILGYSVHDTIVVFDRVRENLSINMEKNVKEEFETTVGKSVTQTLARSINTSLTTFILLLALYFFGPAATKQFSLLLGIGIIVGAYSSIFVASPLLVTLYKLQKK